jgi:hypothetical protein
MLSWQFHRSDLRHTPPLDDRSQRSPVDCALQIHAFSAESERRKSKSVLNRDWPLAKAIDAVKKYSGLIAGCRRSRSSEWRLRSCFANMILSGIKFKNTPRACIDIPGCVVRLSECERRLKSAAMGLE